MRAFFMTENRQFRHFIILTMILIDTHDSAIRWEERLCRTDAGRTVTLGYALLRQVLQLAVLRLRSNDCKDLEIVVLRHELAILGDEPTAPQ